VVVGAGVGELNSRLERLRGLTRDDLQRLARLYLEPQHALTVTVPGSSLLGQLARMMFGNYRAEEESPVASTADTLLRGRSGVVRPATLPIRPPISETNPPMPNPLVHEHHLTNGLRVLIVPNLQSPEVHALLALPFGAWAEEKPGAAAMTLTMLPKGTQAHPEKVMAEEREHYGIQLSGLADADDTRLQLTCRPEYSERAFSLMAEVVTEPTFPEAAFKTTVTQVLTELSITDSEPRSVADREFRRHLFAGHPYGRRLSGEAPEVSALRREDLVGFWSRAAQPNQATLIIAGALTHERALSLAEQFFAQWQNGTGSKEQAYPPPLAPTNSVPTHILLVDWPGALQSEIRVGSLGLAYRDPQKPVADLVSSYFGGSFSSRLMKAIRIEQGKTYGVYGGFQPSRFAGAFRVATFTKTASTADTLRAVLAEIRALRERPPTPEELALHRRYFLGSAAARFETPGEVASQFARLTVNGLPLDYVQKTFAAIARTEAPQCQALVEHFVDPEHLLIVVVGDASRVSTNLQSIAAVTVLDRAGNPTK